MVLDAILVKPISSGRCSLRPQPVVGKKWEITRNNFPLSAPQNRLTRTFSDLFCGHTRAAHSQHPALVCVLGIRRPAKKKAEAGTSAFQIAPFWIPPGRAWTELILGRFALPKVGIVSFQVKDHGSSFGRLHMKSDSRPRNQAIGFAYSFRHWRSGELIVSKTGRPFPIKGKCHR